MNATSPASDATPPVPPAPEPLLPVLLRALVAAAGLVVLLWFLFVTRHVVMLALLALVLAMVINAPVAWLERRRLSRGVATLAVALVLAAVVGGIGWVAAPRVVAEVPRLIDELPAMVEGMVGRLTAVFGDHPEVERQLGRVVDWAVDSIGMVWQQADALVGAFVLTLFVVALVLYLVANPQPLLAAYIRAMPPRHRAPAARAFARASRMVVGWVFSNAVLGGIKAVASFLFLTFMGIPGAVLWSALALFGGLIPRIGFYIMAIPPVLVAVVEDPGNALWVALFYWALSEILGNFVAPKVQGDLMDLHPVVILFMTLALAYAFGALGVILAPPAAAILKAYVDEFYLRGQPDDPRLDLRVDAMIRRDPGAVR
jgi:putative permease